MPQTLRLFAANGDAVAESPGTLWDLLANVGSAAADLDVAAMTVAFIDSPSNQVLRVQPLGAALATTMDEDERKRTVKALKDRATGYRKLADWLVALGKEQAAADDVPKEQE